MRVGATGHTCEHAAHQRLHPSAAAEAWTRVESAAQRPPRVSRVTLAGQSKAELRRVPYRSSLVSMTTVADITGAVKRLPKKDLARFRKWFAEYDAAV